MVKFGYSTVMKIVDKTGNGRLFPHAPTSWLAIIIPFGIALSILYFDAMQPELYRTNPVIIFAVPILFSLAYMRGESFETISKGWGFAVPTTMDKIITVVSVIVGLSVGIGLFYFLTINMSIIPLYFIPLSGVGITGIFMLYLTVSVGEEVMVLQYSRIAANKFYSYGWKPMTSVLVSLVVGRLFWAALHFFSYGASIETLPLFVMAFGLGLIFSLLSLGFASLRGRYFMLLLCIAAHLSYDIYVAMYLLMII